MEQTSNCPSCNGKFKEYLEVKDHFLSKETFNIQACISCNLLRTNPAPPADSIGKYYETNDYLSHGDGQKGLFAWLYRQAKRYNIGTKARILNKLAPQSHLLDYGCGTGDFIQYCQELGFEIRGAEPSAQALAHVSPLVVDKIISPESELNSDTKYDLITMWHVLEHIHEPRQVLSRLKEKINPAGHMIIALPNPKSLDAIHYGKHWAGWDVPRHLWHYEPRAIISLAESIGYEHVDTHPMWFDAFYVSLLSERYKKGSALIAVYWAILSNFNALFKRKRDCSSQIYVFKAEKGH